MTEIADIPFRPGQESGWDPLAGATVSAVNVIIDGKGAVRRRPCVGTYSGVQSTALEAKPVVGLHATSEDKPNIYAITGDLPGATKIHRLLTSTSGVLKNETSTDRPVFAETDAMVTFADGRRISRILLGDQSVAPLSDDAPKATHIIAQASRLLANDIGDNASAIHYSDVATGGATLGHETWGGNGGSGQFTAEARPDPIVALGENSNEVFAFGRTTVQAFVADSSLVYTPISTREFGCSAPHGIIRDDQSFAWLDHRRRFVHSDGRSVNIISQPIQGTLDDMPRVDDCFGFRVLRGPVDVLVWKFPTDGRTFAYQKGGGWSLWMGWDEVENAWKNWSVTAHTHIHGENVNLVGTEDGFLGEMTFGSFTDLGARVPAHVETGHINRGTDLRKLSACLRLTLQRGRTAALDEPLGSFQMRDDGGEWSSPIDVSFGSTGDRETVVEFRSLGVYRTRAWRFNFSRTTEDFVLARATEEFEILQQ